MFLYVVGVSEAGWDPLRRRYVSLRQRKQTGWDPYVALAFPYVDVSKAGWEPLRRPCVVSIYPILPQTVYPHPTQNIYPHALLKKFIRDPPRNL